MAIIVTLLLAGAALLLIEVVLPGGVIGILGLVLLLAGVIAGFVHDLELGLAILLGLLLLAPIALWTWIHYFPSSRFGKPLTLEHSTDNWRAADTANDRWLNRTGQALSDLRPSGIVGIDGERLDVVSDGRLITKGTMVRIIAVEGNRVIVAPEVDAGQPRPQDQRL